MDGLDRYERMAQRTRERTALRTRREQAEMRHKAEASPGWAPDQLDGESGLIDYNEHFGHRTHINFLAHGNGVTCSCGALMGCFSFIPPTEEEYAQMLAAQPDGCPVCDARGIEYYDARQGPV